MGPVADVGEQNQMHSSANKNSILHVYEQTAEERRTKRKKFHS